jgi:branched-chain amino acid aminotransferase
MSLLRANGITVIEKALTYRDLETSDEIFSTGNYSKVVPVTKIGDRSLDFGPLYKRARELYWDFAHTGPAVQARVALAAPSAK